MADAGSKGLRSEPRAGRATPKTGATDSRPEPAVALQILAAEHSSLLATRSLTWTESFSRAQMFLSVLSAAVIALVLVAQATAFGEGFLAFALVVLPVVLFLGLTTFVRLVAANNDEGRRVVGMNRIRGGYLELAPDLERYFVTGHHDDEHGVMVTGGWQDFPTFSGFVTTPATVAVISSVVAATTAFIAAGRVLTPAPAALFALVVFVAAVVWANRYETASMGRALRRLPPINPTPPTVPGVADASTAR